MPAYFADASFWTALNRANDPHHARAIAWFGFIVQNNSAIVTTEAALWTWLDSMADPATRAAAAASYRRYHSDPHIQVIDFQPMLIDGAVQAYESDQNVKKNWTLTDCLSLIVMALDGMKEALSSNPTLAQAGHKLLLLEDPPA